MNYKNQLFKKDFSFFALIACSLLFVGIYSCNNEPDLSTAPTTASTNKPDTSNAIVGLATVNLPNYQINASALPIITGGVGNPIPSKLLLKFEFANISNPLNTMNLLLYPANDHAHYGTQTVPIQIAPAGYTPVTGVTNLVLGNNEIATSDLVQPPPNHHAYYFHYLKLIPKITINPYDHKPHLVFIIKAYDINDAEITVKNKIFFTIPDSNPCPPNQPGN